MLKIPGGKTSMEWWVPIAICALLFVVMAVLAGDAYIHVRDSARQAAEERLINVARQLTGLLQGQARDLIATTRKTADRPELSSYLQAPSQTNQARAAAVLREGAGNDRVGALELVDSTGRALLTAGLDSASLARLDPLSWVSSIGSDSGAVGPFGFLGDTLVLPVAAPVLARGKALGYLIRWNHIGMSQTQQRETFQLIDEGASLYLGSVGDTVWTDQVARMPPPPADLSRVRPDSVLRYNRPGEGSRLAVPARVPGTPWIVLAELAEASVIAPAHHFLVRVEMVALVLLGVGWVGVWFLVRRITGPLGALTRAAETIRTGDYSGRVRVTGSDELARLGITFNLMAERVQETHRRLEANLAELQATREQFAHTQRIEAVGRLAGGVAHDFNNLLTVILAELDLAKEDLLQDSRYQETFRQIQAAAERAAGLTGQLLAFSRRRLIEPTTFSMNELVSDLDQMFRRLIGEDIDLKTLAGAERPTVRADRGQIEQVVMNLVINARDAMPQGGRLVVETQNVTLDEDYARSRTDVAPGDYVMLAVSDTGTGMSDEVKTHLFEPFFTTKERGKGTGLGLATCYGIVKQAGGHIAAYSESGTGTTMKVYLPGAAPEEPRSPPSPPRPGGHETILLVEDEPAVREVTRRILTAQGYLVLEAGGGASALQVLGAHAEPIHLLLTDVVLPDLGGRALAARVLSARPGIRVLYTSGYTDDVVLQHQLVERDVALLQKPFTAESLAEKVREVLDTP